MDNKLTGSFYTPEKLIEYMTEYAQKRISPRNILEPSAGDGRFVKFLKKFSSSVSLVEIEEEKAVELNNLYGNNCEIYCDDFLKFAMEHKTQYDLIIGNEAVICGLTPEKACNFKEFAA